MTQKDKELLLKDLSARLPYGVIVKYKSRQGEGDVQLGCGNIGYVSQLGNGWWKECKPYLRSMSSMTEEERNEHFGRTMTIDIVETSQQVIDWLNAHHFDFRNLVERGLAIDCTDLNVY